MQKQYTSMGSCVWNMQMCQQCVTLNCEVVTSLPTSILSGALWLYLYFDEFGSWLQINESVSHSLILAIGYQCSDCTTVPGAVNYLYGNQMIRQATQSIC